MRTEDCEYSARLLTKEAVWWKSLLDVQAPYRWNLKRLQPGFTLDIGCGLGRNLLHLNGNGVGIDHNQHAVEIARSRGLQAFTIQAFQTSSLNQTALFDSILMSHVAEHLMEGDVLKLLKAHIPLLKPNGQVILICPQEYGYRSDSTHVQFLDFAKLRGIACEAGLIPVREYSFPLPRVFGHLFKYNEFVSISRKGHE
jgi:2-polyprenyl-3-methyl-5-hydroxy-6-metoxy-1,4-benzoquinol methylase